MTHKLTAAKVNNPATLAQRSAAASRNEMHTDVAGASPVMDSRTAEFIRDCIRSRVGSVYGSGSVGSVSDSGSVDVVSDSGSVGVVSGKATVNLVSQSAKIENDKRNGGAA